MSDVVNLNKFRKKKARGDKDKRAEENRARHGRTKAEKEREASDKDRARRLLDGHKREED
ncbi:MAG: DUF4169 family protein [Parvularculaceae bacterium]